MRMLAEEGNHIKNQLYIKYLKRLEEKQGPYKVFISGGMSNVPDYRERFAKAQHELVNIGFTHIVSPVDIDDNLPEDMVLEERFEHTSGAMKECDAVYFMEGYKDSKGAKKEFDMISKDGNKDIILKDSSGKLRLYNSYYVESENKYILISIMTLE